ncbi:MAG: glycosyltransferase [Cyanobium sp.]
MRIVVAGFLGLFPAGGATWDYLQYPLGLLELGHDVYYLEDTELWPIFQNDVGITATLNHLRTVMAWAGMDGRWAYRDEASGQWYGLPPEQVAEIWRTADLFINVSCANVLREETLQVSKRVLIDSDPMFTQVQILQDRGILKDQGGVRQVVDGHTHHFSFGELIGTPPCRIPPTGHHWRTTRQPICLNRWPVSSPPADGAFTTVMNWSAARELSYGGETWGQKNREFEAILPLPRQVAPIRLAVALARSQSVPFPEEQAREGAWRLLDPEECAGNWLNYRNFLGTSLGEFSVAKHTYVKARTGWFSCRSACYLASGRPVVTQDTGWSELLPHGEGLFAFSRPEEAAEALREISAEPERHGLAARRIAEAYFDSKQVLQNLLDEVMD